MTSPQSESRWLDPASHDPEWSERTLILAQAVRGPTVIEFGAGNLTAKAAIVARGLAYSSADVRADSRHDYCVDFNSDDWGDVPGHVPLSGGFSFFALRSVF